MKKGRLSKTFALSGVLLLGGLLATSVVSCDTRLDTSSTTTKIVITGGSNGYIGGYCQLTATVFNYDGDDSVTWNSSNTTVATVDEDGLVSFLNAGTVEITATLGSASSSPLSLTVSEGDAALEITSSPYRLSYYTNETLSYDGIVVTGYSYKSGYRLNDSGIDLTNVVTFSEEEGTTLTAGTHTITVSYGSYASASFTIEVGETITEKKLYVASNPTTSTYVIPTSSDSSANNTFSSSGLSIQGLTYVDGVLDDTQTVTLSSSEYSLSVNDSQTLLTEGSKTISVYADGYISTSFNVMVYTEDTTVVDLIETLQSATNYQVEIFNNVGTTSDSYGFHYLRTFTEDYYDEISYQNTYNSTTSQIIFSTDDVKSHIGYTSYEYFDSDSQSTTYGIVKYSRDSSSGRLAYDSLVTETTSSASWWDLADTLATLLTTFDLDDLPAYTLNDSYLAITVDQVAGDDSSGTQTIANYSLLEQFFSYVGWSSSLITVTDRMTISFNSSGNLEMRVDFGYYGYTSLVIQNIGTASNATVERLVNSGVSSSDWANLHTPKDEIINAIQPIFANNYTLTDYSTSAIYSYMTPTYAYYNTGRYGYFIKDDEVYSFTGSNTSSFTYEKVSDYDSNTQTFAEYVTDKATTEELQYLSVAMSSVFGDGTGSNYGKLYALSRNESYSYGSYVTYETFDSDFISAYGDLIGSTIPSQYNRFWMMTYYDDADSLDGVNGYDIWVLNSNLSGYVLSITNVESTSVSWIETAIDTVS